MLKMVRHSQTNEILIRGDRGWLRDEKGFDFCTTDENAALVKIKTAALSTNEAADLAIPPRHAKA